MPERSSSRLLWAVLPGHVVGAIRIRQEAADLNEVLDAGAIGRRNEFAQLALG
jgi:hypothetical protein